MRIQLANVLALGIVILISVTAVSAQNTLPDPHNDKCWSSLAALRACQLQAEEQAQDYAQRCTSYPEYQCIPEYIALREQSAKRPADSPKQPLNAALATTVDTASGSKPQSSREK